MARNQTTFSDRLERIEQTRRGGLLVRRRQQGSERSIVIHPDGYVQHVTMPRRRLRFVFPLKGMILAAIAAVLVKGYLIWMLGDDVYGAAVAQLLNGNPLERAAGLVLAPDALSNVTVDIYQHLYRVLVSLATALETGTFPTLA